jgi:hypothetical protein
MKCFSVHILHGVTEGIELHGPKQNYILIGSYLPETEMSCMGVPVHDLGCSDRKTGRIHHARIKFGNQVRYSFGGLPAPIRKQAELYKAGKSESSRALVMLETYARTTLHVVLPDGDWYGIHDRTSAASAKKRFPVSTEIAWGYQLNFPHAIEQQLIRMDRGSKLLIFSNDSASLLSWDGSLLSLTRNVERENVVLVIK